MRFWLTLFVCELTMVTFFVWQLMIGLIVGKEAGWMLFLIAGFFPTAILGFPWFTAFLPEGPFDLTYQAFGNALAVRYHVVAAASLLTNGLLLSVALEGVWRLLDWRRGKR